MRVWQDYMVMFADILKAAVTKYAGGVPYWPSSPSANFEDTTGNRVTIIVVINNSDEVQIRPRI